MTKFKTQFNHDRVEGIKFIEPSLVEPQFGYECDINNIVSGCVSTLNHIKPVSFQDLTTAPDLETACNLVADAKSRFEQLPSNVRARFNNDPKQLMKFIGDEKNYDEALKLGLVNKRVDTPQPTVTPVVTPTDKSGGSADVSEPSA